MTHQLIKNVGFSGYMSMDGMIEAMNRGRKGKQGMNNDNLYSKKPHKQRMFA